MLIKGPTALSSLSSNSLQGSYVSVDASEVIVAFATLTSKTDDSSETLKTYYLLPDGEGNYIAVMDAKERNGNLLEKAMEQSHEYYLGDLETLTELGDIKGTATALDDDMVAYMVDCIENYELPGYEAGADTAKLVCSVQINLDQVGFFSTRVTYIILCVGGLFLLLALLLLIPVLAGCYQKNALNFILREHSIEEANTMFEESVSIERVWVGEFLLYQKGAKTNVIRTSDLIWGYAMPEPMVVSQYRWPVALFDINQRQYQICFKVQNDCQKFLDAVSAQGYPFVSGYTSALSQKFQQNPEKFIADAYKSN